MLAAAFIGAAFLVHGGARSEIGDEGPTEFAPEAVLVRDGVRFELAFNDEFDTLQLEAPNRLGWTPHFAHGPSGGLDERTLRNNRELQIYIDPARRWHGRQQRPATIEARDGVLFLRAYRIAEADRDQIFGYEYASGMIASHRLFRQTYGYFEMRARLPAGRGLWPAFWLLPQSGRWPPEIDVLEALGHEPNAYYASYHSNAESVRSARTTKVESAADLSTDFHTYGIIWGAEDLVYFLDGVEVARYPTPADMHEPMYLLLNLAIGGVWAGAPNALTQFPASYEIDYVRAYRLAPPQADTAP